MMMDIDTMIFEMDINTTSSSKKLHSDSSVPSAPPPSPNFHSRRKPMNITVQLEKLFDCCEDIISRNATKDEMSSKSSPLHMKRKNSDSDDCPSYGSSPGCSADYSSYTKRSRSSLNLDNLSLFKSSDLSLRDHSLSVNSSSSVQLAGY